MDFVIGEITPNIHTVFTNTIYGISGHRNTNSPKHDLVSRFPLEDFTILCYTTVCEVTMATNTYECNYYLQTINTFRRYIHTV